MLSFDCPIFLLGIPATLFVAFILEKLHSKSLANRTVLISNFKILEEAASSQQNLWLRIFPVLQVMALSFGWIALSAPSISSKQAVKSAQVLIAVDKSKSMAASDFEPDRITAAKEAILDFIKGLPKNRKNGIQLGVILFDRNIVLASNLSFDKSASEKSIKGLTLASLGEGTAIGEAILQAFTIFETSKLTKGERHLILISDGENNSGIEPLEALEQVRNLKIYTIGIGSPFGSIVGDGLISRLDRETLKQIASQSGGEYFEAKADSKQLKDIYKLLTQNYRVEEVKHSFTPYFLLASILLCSLCFGLGWTKLKGI
ncbi:MAG: VWA domain-containing protein [Candidatus Caenarcaniphilales bacterium]|nr:VWA domain-containing protein [Candidatus Caenarcaniphilales bacterium]